jgi:hypothetical protein
MKIQAWLLTGQAWSSGGGCEELIDHSSDYDAIHVNNATNAGYHVILRLDRRIQNAFYSLNFDILADR